jgi:hypothetical protein
MNGAYGIGLTDCSECKEGNLPGATDIASPCVEDTVESTLLSAPL